MRIARVAVVAAALAAVSFGARSASAQAAGFPDVPANHWAAAGVAKLVSVGILRGYPADPVAPQGAAAKPAAKSGFDGNKPVTRYELAVTLYRFVQYIDRADKQKKSKTGAQAAPADGAEAVKRLIAEGYLPKDTPLATEGTRVVTANQLADALTAVITRSREKQTPITPDSLKTLPMEKPQSAPGT